MPLIRPIEMNAPRHAASASASSERCWLGRRTGCRINDDPWRRRAKLASAAPSSNASYQQLQPPSPINHKKITQPRQKLAYFSAGIARMHARCWFAGHRAKPMGLLAVINSDGGSSIGQLTMDPSDEFFSEEFDRYTAECRRMARLARAPSRKSGNRTLQRFGDGLARVWAQYFEAASHPRLVTSPVRR